MGDARDAPTPTHGRSPGSPAAARRAAIEHAYQLGVMNEEEYHSKMATQGRSSGSHQLVTKKRRGEWVTLDRSLHSSLWNTMATYDSYPAALSALKKDTHGKVRWAQNTGKPDDRRFVCNAHEGCERPFRILAGVDGQTYVQEYTGIDHSGVPKVKRRKNSVLTYEQEGIAMEMMTDGIVTYPACIMRI
jgi:hypothetical protein